MASKKAKRGKQPKMVVTSETLGAEIVDDFLPNDEPAAKVPLEWQLNEEMGVWTAKSPHGGVYDIQEGESVFKPGEQRWFAELFNDGGIEELDDYATREEAEAACQWHADTELVWRLGDRVWTADTAERHTDTDDGDDLGPVVYAIEPSEDGKRFYCALYTEPVQTIGDSPAASLEEAQERCQAHYREQHPPPQAEPVEGPPEPAEAAPAPGQLPPPQRADWVIPMPLTDAEMVEAFEEGRELRRKRRRLQREVAASAERHKKLATRNKELIEELEDEIEKLDEHMPEVPVDCVRSFVRDGDEIFVQYTRSDPHDDGGKVTEILHERRLEQWEQRQLFGEGDPPPDKPPSATEPPPDDEPADPPPATEPHPEPEAEPLLTWRKITVEDDNGKRAVYVSGDPEGEHYRLDKVPQKAGGDGLWHVLYFVAPGCCLPLPGRHTTLKAAKAETSMYNTTRLRWETPPEGWGELLESTGRYQLRKAGDGRVKAQYIGPEESRDLGVHDDLWAAQVACQADAGERRAEAGG